MAHWKGFSRVTSARRESERDAWQAEVEAAAREIDEIARQRRAEDPARQREVRATREPTPWIGGYYCSE